MAPFVQLRSSSSALGRSSTRSSAFLVRACARPTGASNNADGARAGRPKQAAGEALMHSLSGLHQASGRESKSVSMVLGLDNSEEAWRCIDKRVNSYPALREFTAIGSGGSSFRQSMVNAVQAVVGRVETVTQRCSAGGRYVSVTVGPVLVTSADDVLEVYTRMRSDERLRYFL